MASNSMAEFFYEEPSSSYVLCTICSAKFNSTTLLNAHKKLHHIGAGSNKVSHIICPLCEKRYEFKSHHMLRIHLTEKHEIDIEFIILEFPSVQEYDIWVQEQQVETNYIKTSSKYFKKGEYKEICYGCNRSDIKGNNPLMDMTLMRKNYKIILSIKSFFYMFLGYTPKCTKVEELSGKTKINGMCSSRIISTLYDNGTVTVHFWKTHVGHDIDLCLHFSMSEKNNIVEKYKSSVSVDKILQDVKKILSPEIQGVLNKNDISYLIQTHNINIIRNPYEIKKLIKDKLWKRVIDIYRPNANNYKHKMIIKAHRMAEKVQEADTVTRVLGDSTKFNVRTENEFCTVKFNKVCENVCTPLYCIICKICIHHYSCDCSEFMVKNILCIHVHLVKMYEERMGISHVTDNVAKTLEDNIVIKLENEDIQSNPNLKETIPVINNGVDNKTIWDNLTKRVFSLQQDNFNHLTNMIQEELRKMPQKNEDNCKRKRETQEFFVLSKRKKVGLS